MSTQIPVIDLKGKEVGTQNVPAEIFSVEPNEDAVHFVCNGQRFRFSQKTAKTKGRAEVSGGGKKARQQKGSGRSRQGGNRAPHWVGGGVVFGPTGEKRNFKINKKLKKLALASILSDRQSSGQIRVLKNEEIASPKTKPFSALLKSLKLDGARVAFVLTQKEDALTKSIRNIHRVDVLSEDKWTPVDFIKSDSVIFTHDALESLSQRFQKGA
jgi:large subunit ribosomal protein L4